MLGAVWLAQRDLTTEVLRERPEPTRSKRTSSCASDRPESGSRKASYSGEAPAERVVHRPAEDLEDLTEMKKKVPQAGVLGAKGSKAVWQATIDEDNN